MIKPLGPEGVQQRMAEIQAKLDKVFGAPEQSFEAVTGLSKRLASPDNGGLTGAITPDGTSGGFAPLKLGGGIGVETSTAAGSTRFAPQIEKAARENNVDQKLLSALVEAESDYNPMCRSKAGAMGLTQLMPETARSMGVSNAFDPEQNLMGGAKYLRQLLDKFGAVEPALAAYNAGPGAVLKYGGIPPYKETQNYVAKIMARYNGVKP